MHSLTNGYLAKLAARVGCKLVVNSDAHQAEQMMTMERAKLVARGAGLEEEQVYRALVTNPEKLLNRAFAR